jgi:hypothetical protein
VLILAPPRRKLTVCLVEGCELGLDPTQFFGTEPTRSVFSCISDFGDGVNPSHVCLKKLETWVGWHDNTVSVGPTCHQWTPAIKLSSISFSFSFFLSPPYPLPRVPIVTADARTGRRGPLVRGAPRRRPGRGPRRRARRARPRAWASSTPPA